MKRILIVDDEEPIRRLLARICGDAGHQVQSAGDAQEALELCLKFKCFDVVVSDVRLRGMDGHQLARDVAGLCPATRVVLMSASDAGFCDSCPYRKGCRFLPKPFGLEHVLETISEALAAPAPGRKHTWGDQ